MKNLLLLTTFILFAIVCKAQTATLDESFGIDGKVITNFGENTSPEIVTAVIQTDNKIIETGHYYSGTIEHPSGFLALRYTTDGALDNSYGDSGKVVIQFSFEDQAYVNNAAIQKDNKVLLAGYGWYNYFDPVYSGIIARLNTDGSLDSAFGTNGTIQLTINKSGSFGAVALQEDNKIVATGGGGGSVFLMRFLENGNIDNTFGQNGYAYTSKYFSFSACKIQPDKKIVVAGYDYQFTSRRFCLQRYLANGTLDESFGNNGTVITSYGDDGLIHDFAFQADGKIVVTGETSDYSADETFFATARYNPNGTLDSSFGTYGKVTTMFGDSICISNSVAVLKDGNIIIGGYKQLDTSGEYALLRLTSSGHPDAAFGIAGEVTTDFGFNDRIQSVLIQSTGKIVAAGWSFQPPVFNCSLARYNTNKSKKQIIVSKLRRWLQHHNGIMWDGNSNINSYIVQRSYNGINWSTVHRQQTTVNGQRLAVNYYNDASLLNGNNYYRLQTTAANGAVNYSNVIGVTNNDIKISPNPSTNILHVEGLPLNQKIKLTVLNFSGNIAISQQLTANSSFSFNLNIALLKRGDYLLKIETNDGVVTKKFVKE